MKTKSGQSVVELVFAIGIVAIVITGVIILLVNTINSRNRGFDRKKAAELSQIVMEDLISQKKNDPDNFWKLQGQYNKKWSSSDFDNYIYSVGFTNIDDASSNCGVGLTDCANVVVKIGWSGGTGGQNQTSTFQRFFSRRSD